MRRCLSALALLAVSLPITAFGQTPLYPSIKVETSVGDFVLQLNGAKAPLSVANFMRYVESGHYEGLIFHRVIPGFMAQSGGYDTDLAERETEDPIPNESGNGLENRRGSIAMARTNNPHSATSQFYINLVDNDALNPSKRRWGYAVFGEVIEGMEVLDQIAEIPTGPRGRFPSDVPQSTILIEKMTLIDG